MPTPPRLTARVLPVSPDGDVLLLQDQDPAFPGVLRWGTIGGAVDLGETLVQAALRELREETGIVTDADALTEPFHRLSYEFGWDGTTYLADATFYALPMGRDVEVSLEGLEAAEVGNVFEARWWTPEDLEADGTAVAPQIPDIMRRAVRVVRSQQPLRRTTARVVPVNRHGEVLMLLVCDPARPDTPVWISVGGGVEPGESLVDGALRELREETGIVVDSAALVGPFHHGVHEGEWKGTRVIRDSHYFAVRVDDVVVSFDGLEPAEIDTTQEARWIPVAELTELPVAHEMLPHIAAMAVAALAGDPHVVRRRTARVLPVNALGEVLLMESCDPAHPEQPFWCSIGGAVDGDESLAQAAVRELREETGLEVAAEALGSPFDRAEITFPYNSATFVNDSSWFAVGLEAGASDLINHDHSELILSYAWWTPEALRKHGDLPNPDLPDRMAAAIARARGTDG